MKHLVSQSLGREGGVKVVYLLDHQGDVRDTDVFEYEFHRTVLGVSALEEVHYAVVVGERVLWSPDPQQKTPERIYVVLDEIETESLAHLVKELVRLKDIYLCRTLYHPVQPATMVDFLRREDGLCRYKSPDAYVNRAKWPTYVDDLTKVALYGKEVPADKQIQADIDTLLKAQAMDPHFFNLPLMGAGGKPLPRIILPEDLKTRQIRTSVRQGMAQYELALWMATMGLEGSRPKRRTPKRVTDDEHQWKPDPVGGY